MLIDVIFQHLYYIYITVCFSREINVSISFLKIPLVDAFVRAALLGSIAQIGDKTFSIKSNTDFDIVLMLLLTKFS